jgi:predicted acylesterase/phospholipase RssA
LDHENAKRFADGSYELPSDRVRDVRVYTASDPEAALRFLREQPADAVVVDTRAAPFAADAPNASEPGPFSQTRAGQVLAGLFPDSQLFAGVPRDRLIGIVGDGASGTAAAYELGRYRIGRVLFSPSRSELLGTVERVLERHAGGRIAVCLAGGGIEGLFYELGVLRALDSLMVDRSIVDVDLFCGISAGAVAGAFLANGLGPDEIARGLSGGSARIDAISRHELFDPNVRELTPRLAGLARDLLRGRRGPRGALSSFARALPSAIFAGDRFRDWLRRQLSKPGMSDRFDELRRPLFVGATDQDTSQPVIFGEEGTRHVPIHRAVRASSALVPFYAPEVIEGRRYIDGAFSRTTNMRVAVREGATLVILVDPLVPVFAEDSGYVHERGGMFATMQGLKALVNGRFDKAVHAISEMFPDVSFWLFKPEGDEMRILSGSPMKYFFRREVEDVAFRLTRAKCKGWLSEMTRDFARHGVSLRDPDAEPANSVRPDPLELSHLGVEG